ncbi:MAG: YraN family protein [Clostridia bacterium]|nr:YraN family protein [Clostridia bacterium]
MPDTQKNFHKKFLGRSGESKAVKYLKKKGYKIIEKNYTTSVGEIDVIALSGEVWVFAEVKTRADETFGLPSEAVTPRKQNKYRLVAMQFLNAKDIYDEPMRFDVIEVINGEINHIENAF